jgi:transformation/transcription domain-associated protein
MLAMKIVAKLGGINRKFLKEQPIVDIDEYESVYQVKLRFQDNIDPLLFPMDKFLNLSRRIFFSGSDDISRIQSFNFLKSCFISLLNLNGNISDFKFPETIGPSKSPKLALTISSSTNIFDPYNVEGKSFEQKNKKTLNSESNVFKKLLSTILIANGDPILKEHSKDFIDGIFQHFSLLFISQCNHQHEPYTELNMDLFLDSIVEMFSHDKSDVTKENAEKTFESFINIMENTCQDKELLLQFLVWDKLATRLSHCCYQKEWYKKLGGCRGISSLCRKLSPTWIKKHEIDFVKALLFIIKDSQSYTPNFAVDIAIESLKQLIYLSHGNEKSIMKENKETGKEISKKLHDLLLLLVSELSSAHDAVRKEVQILLKLVSDLTDQSITNLLDNFKNSLTNSIVVSRFKQLPSPLQTVY